MKTLTEHLKNSMERKYHLSYDVNKKFGENSNEARKYILEILKDLGATSVNSPCKSTIIFTYPDENFDMQSFYLEIKDYFYFSICLVSIDDETYKEIEKINKSREIDNTKLQEDWSNII